MTMTVECESRKKSDMNKILFSFFSGNGRVSCPRHQQLPMCISTHSTISSSKQSKSDMNLEDYSKVVHDLNRLTLVVLLTRTYFCCRMYGFFQTTFYFGYMALFSLALGIMCGK